ncbi:LysR family transcriptional regulator [Bacillus cabrialesii]|uniref:LysR family transcriptional regulator n=1 Tax=Bacillus cabrialesii subsp. tritici TaxID=2944916 RepID=A0ABT9DG42_9BACI|nr:LysR family transcriptional regulator [Bacillus cabrialesii]MDO8223650.1 LysR family transcriptional regulator [Bacillus cabrialesii subsp. tritici]
MDIKVMEYAAEIARRQSFTKAAEHLHIAQPSLSQQIKKLENELGLSLFHRSHGSVTLTPHGRRFIEKAEDIIRSRDDLLREMQERSQGIGHKLSIGIPAVTGRYIFPPLLKQFLARYPHVEVQLVEKDPVSLEEMTAKGEVDLSVLSLPIEDERLSITPFLTEPIVLAVPKEKQRWMPPEMTVLIEKALEGEKGPQPCVPLDMVRHVPFILLKEGYGFRRTVLDLCAESGFKPNAAFKTSHIETAQSLVANGLGVTMAPNMVRRDKDPGVIYLSIQSAPSRTLVFVFLKNRYISLTAQAFIELSRESLKQTFDEDSLENKSENI